MKCRACNRELADEWSFCPYCGASKSLQFRPHGVEDIFRALEKGFTNFFDADTMMDLPFGKGFMVELSQEGGEPRVSIKELGERQPEAKAERQIPKGAEVVEPKISVKDGGRLVEVLLPGVNSEENISVRQLENSVEVRAFTDRKIYFTIIPLRFRHLEEQSFENGLLTLRFS